MIHREETLEDNVREKEGRKIFSVESEVTRMV